MVDIAFPFILLVLITIIVFQAVERHVYASQMQEEQSKLITAFLSKNATEYAVSTKITKQEQSASVQNDEVDASDLTDKEFDELIKNQNKIIT